MVIYREDVQNRMVTVGVCVVAKNNSDLVRACLSSVKEMAKELVVLDVGSTDSTPDVIKEFTTKVYHFSLGMEAGEAYNEALQHSTTDYVLFLQPHEVLGKESGELVTSIVHTGKEGYSCRIRQYTNDSSQPGWRKIEGEFPFAGYIETSSVRLFRRGDIRFTGGIRPKVKVLDPAKTSIIIHQFPEWNNQTFTVKSMPDDAETLVDIGIQAQKKGDIPGAMSYYSKALQLDSTNTRAAINLSFCYLHAKQLQTALDVIQKALALTPHDTALLNNLATYHIYAKEFDKGLEVCAKVIAEDQHNFSAHQNMGYCHVALENYTEAIAEYKRAIVANPQSQEARMNLALAFMKEGDREKAKLALQGLLELNAVHKGAVELLATLG